MKSKVAVALLQLWTISVVLSVGALHASTTENTIYNFQGGLDGAGAYNGLLADKQGNLYGVTKQGGTPPGLGVVFEISPSGTTWTESVLYRFRGGSDGAFPWTTLVTDAGGNLYGTTTAGGTGTACGTDGCGTIFELSPPGASGQPWTETVLYSFRGGDDGSLPYGGVAFDATGNLYGTTNTGGRPGFGTVFELSPSSGSGEWTETILHSFRGNGDGGDPLGGIVLGKDDILYGTTQSGGTFNDGIIYEVVLQSGVRTYHPAYSFQGGLHGQDPASAMIADHSGNLYGTTVGGGISGFGTVYEVTLSTSGSVLTETALYSFQGSADGGYPEGGLVFDQSGNLYGTTSGGGGSGTVFELAPPSAPGGAWSETVLHLFVNLAGGLHPNASLTFGKAGSLYSTAPIGGTNNAGVAFRVAP